MSLAEIEAAFAALKYVVPAVEAAIAALKTQIPQDKADIEATVAAAEKVFGDFKGLFVAIDAAIKAASEQK